MIHSLAGTLPENGIIRQRPFRNPHHSASLPALIGGGVRAKPGEISLAHHGVLFLDELPEFNRATIESLRQPMETREAVIARVNSRAVYPANFQLIAAMNPQRRPAAVGAIDAGTHQPQRVDNTAHGPTAQRDIPGELTGKILSGQQPTEQANTGARITQVQRL